MKAFYPKTTNKIIHKGKSGNIYRLDGFQMYIALSDLLRKDLSFEVIDISVNKNLERDETIKLINSVHDKSILEAYKSGIPEDLANSSGVMWQPDLYNYVLELGLVSKLVTEEALKNGKSLAIIGGGHHAEYSKPLGFCLINTMAIAANFVSELNKKVAIIDLDTHYSNGCFDILKNNDKVSVYSLWNQKLDKWKDFKSEGNIWHEKVNNAKDYFDKLNILVEKVKNDKPDLLIYHLGLDVLDTDRMGGVKGMDEKNLVKRENAIKKLLQSLNVPYAIFLGGAYIDWSKGEEYAINRRTKLTELQHKLLYILTK